MTLARTSSSNLSVMALTSERSPEFGDFARLRRGRIPADAVAFDEGVGALCDRLSVGIEQVLERFGGWTGHRRVTQPCAPKFTLALEALSKLRQNFGTGPARGPAVVDS